MESTLTYFIALQGAEKQLQGELQSYFPAANNLRVSAGLFSTNADISTSPIVAFCAQAMPAGLFAQEESISAWAAFIVSRLVETKSIFSENPWRLDIFDVNFIGKAKQPRRCQLVEQKVHELLKTKFRSALRKMVSPSEVAPRRLLLIQLALISPTTGIVSIMTPELADMYSHCSTPLPYACATIPEDKFPPSRAYRKLLEAELHLGLKIKEHETCVELGAAPGGWSAIVLARGAKLVALDRSELRSDLMRHENLTFIKGDGFKYVPANTPVDWLLCDMIAFPERSLQLLEEWLLNGWCHKFILTFKFKGHEDHILLSQIKAILLKTCSIFKLRHMLNNKNEIMAMGQLRTS